MLKTLNMSIYAISSGNVNWYLIWRIAISVITFTYNYEMAKVISVMAVFCDCLYAQFNESTQFMWFFFLFILIIEIQFYGHS